MPDPSRSPTDPPMPAERRVGMGHDDYLALFLEAGDLPPTLQRLQDRRLQGPDARDRWFARHQGILTGMAVWTAAPSETIFRLVDIRTVFPTARQASAWHVDAMAYNAEHLPQVAGAPPVGTACRVFGGTQPNPLGLGPPLTAYLYLFCSGRVVVKLFTMQGTEAATPLTPVRVADIAQRTAERVERVQAGGRTVG
jgi:hypothetical protein